MVSWAHPSAILVFQFVVIYECHRNCCVFCEGLRQEHHYSLPLSWVIQSQSALTRTQQVVRSGLPEFRSVYMGNMWYTCLVCWSYTPYTITLIALLPAARERFNVMSPMYYPKTRTQTGSQLKVHQPLACSDVTRRYQLKSPSFVAGPK